MKAKSKRKGNFPPLRFPEFKAEWKRKKLGEVMDFKVTNSYSREKLNYEKGTVKNIHYGDIHTKFRTLFNITNEIVPYINEEINIEKIAKDNYCQEGDVIFADASEDLNDVGKCIEIVKLNSEKLLSGLHTLLARPKRNIFFVGFNGYLFKSNFVRSQIQKEAQGIKVSSISAKRISNTELFYPTHQEQTKIASFLSLIDERIQTQMKIIEEWEKFRYGLRFQLFKQFKNDSVKVKPTKNLINYEQPTKYIVSDNNYSQNPLSTPVLTANKAFILGYTNERFGIYDKGDCIIFDDFTMDMKYVTFPFKVKSSAIKILKPKSNINLRYVFEYLLSLNLKSGEHKRHYISEIASKTIPLLKRGQQNTIASLFLSLDYKIVIEKSLLSTYQEQKKYLLRNLFI